MRPLVAVAFLVLLSGSAAAGEHDLPDPRLTPGDAIEGVTAEQVCTPGYAHSVRHVTAETKREVFAEYGLERNHTGYCGGRRGCEIDHVISLELGGSNSIKNLWPQSYDSQPWNAHVKDHLENRLHELVCSGRMSLDEAQHAIATNWISAYQQYVGQPVASK